MNYPGYVARRMLYDVCGILTPINAQYEHGYDILQLHVERFIFHFGSYMIPRLPSRKNDLTSQRKDLLDLYIGIFERIDDPHSLIALKVLFLATYLMMEKYRDSPKLCSNIPFYFEVLTQRLKSWDTLGCNYNTDV